MGVKGKILKEGFKRAKNKFTDSMTKNSTNNMSKHGKVDKMIDTHFAKFNTLVKNKQKEYSKNIMDAAKTLRPNTNDTAAGMVVGSGLTYGAMKANEKKKVQPKPKSRKAFMNTRMRD